MGGILHPKAAKAIAEVSAARALAVPSALVEEMGEARWVVLRDAMERAAERSTGKPHHWRPRVDSDVYELVPVDGE